MAPYLPIERAFGGNAHELSLYVGAVPLMLALWVLVRRNDLGGMKRLAQATAALAVAALLLALGSQGPIHRLAEFVPWAAWFQFSCRYTVLFQFAVAVLAAIGFVLVEREAREKRRSSGTCPFLDGQSRAAALWRQFEVLGATVLVSLAVAVAGLILQSGHHVAPVSRVLVGPLLMAAAALLVIAAAQGVRGALVGMILFMAADLGYYGLSCTLDDPPPGSTTFGPDRGSAGRIRPTPRGPASLRSTRKSTGPADETSTIGNQMTLAGWSRTDGYAALAPSKSLDYFQLPALCVASTRWVHRALRPRSSKVCALR